MRTYYPFAHYDVAGNTAVKYYFFNGQRVATKRGSTVSYLHAEHLGSTVLETNTAGHVSADQRYRAYWGQNLINWGTNGTTSRRYMGHLPASGGWVRLEVPAARVGLAGKTVNGLAFTLYGGRAWWDRAGVRRAVHEVTKYYAFNGQRIARRQDGVLTYLHTDHLGSTLLATNSSGAMVGEHRYRAYGSRRSGDELATDHRFTSQKLDGTGLYYYNARYYDPEIGAFIGCPLGADTLVPRPGGSRTNLLDYNRYLYVRGRPLTMNDPSGHCVNSTTTSQPEEISYDNNECWRLANTIGAMWDSTDYWSNRFTSREVFVNNVANNGYNGTDFFQGQLDNFFSSDEGRAWLGTPPGIPQNVQNDPHCGGAKACQGLLNHAAQVERKCQQIDCVAVGNDLVGVAGTVTVLVACIPGAAVCATSTAALIGGVAATGSTGLGLWITGSAWYEGNATNTDLAITLLTTGGSLVAPDMKDAQVIFSLIQLIWDMNPKPED